MAYCPCFHFQYVIFKTKVLQTFLPTALINDVNVCFFTPYAVEMRHCTKILDVGVNSKVAARKALRV